MRTLAALAGVGLLLACTSTNPAPGGPSFEDEEVRFVAPAGWQMRPSTGVSFGPSWRIRYVANQVLQDDCVTDAVAVTCQPPIDGGLRNDGILVIWSGHNCVAKGCDLPQGALMPIGNRNGVQAAVTAGCEDTDYTERSTFWITVGPQRLDSLLVCARDPSDATRAAFLGFLDAIRWRIP
jgi:hypothetical protein